jgi:uncharacterized protein YgiM (DUF1202 family)
VVNQISNVGKGILGSGRAYWLWSGNLVDSLKIPEKTLNGMVEKNQFKSTEDAERSVKSTLRIVLTSIPVILIVSLISSLSRGAETQSSISQAPQRPISAQPRPKPISATTPTQPEQEKEPISIQEQKVPQTVRTTDSVNVIQSEKKSSSTKFIKASDGHANMRSRPSTEVAVLSKISNGTSVEVIGETTNSSGQRWYEVNVNGQTGWIFSELLESNDSPTENPSSIPTNSSVDTPPQKSSKAEVFRQRFHEEIDKLAGPGDINSAYARQTVQVWESQKEGIELSYRYSCQDVKEHKGNAMELAQIAYEANQQSIPLEQMQVHYQAKFRAAEYAGCE